MHLSGNQTPELRPRSAKGSPSLGRAGGDPARSSDESATRPNVVEVAEPESEIARRMTRRVRGIELVGDERAVGGSLKRRHGRRLAAAFLFACAFGALATGAAAQNEPGAPRNLTKELADTNDVIVRWDPPDRGGPVDYYQYLIGDPEGFGSFWRRIAGSDSTTTSYTFEDVPGGESQLNIRARNSDGPGQRASVVVRINRPATGQPRITGRRHVPNRLRANLHLVEDEDGLRKELLDGSSHNPYRYQWLRGDAEPEACDFTRFGRKEYEMGLAKEYRLKPADAGDSLRVAVCFRDLMSETNVEMVISDYTEVIEADTRPPGVKRAFTSEGGGGVTLFFDEILNPGADPLDDIDENDPPAECDSSWLPPRSAFRVSVEGGKRTYRPREVTVQYCSKSTGRRDRIGPLDGRVHLDLGTTQLFNRGIKQGQSVRVIYTDPTSDDDKAALQDRTGNDVVSFDVEVENRSTQAPSDEDVSAEPKPKSVWVPSDGRTIRITFDEPLNPERESPADAFTVTQGNASLSVNNALLDGPRARVTLQVYPRVRQGGSVTVGYRNPGGNDALQDVDGLLAKTFSRRAANSSALKPGLRPVSAEVQADGLEVEMRFNTRLLENDVSPGAFTMQVGGTAYTFGDIEFFDNGNYMRLSQFGGVVPADETVTVGYTEPAHGALLLAQDSRTTGSFSRFGATNSSEWRDVPVAVDAVAEELDAFDILFVGELDTTVGSPPNSAFNVTIDGTATTFDSVRVVASDRVRISGLARQMKTGQRVVVSYTQPASGIVLQSATTGNALAGFELRVTLVFPPKPVGAQVSESVRHRLWIEFDRPISPDNFPPTSAFTVKVNGVARTVHSVSRGSASEPELVYLTFPTLVRGDPVTVSYEKPAGSRRLRGTNSREVDSFSDYRVDNPNPGVPRLLRLTWSLEDDEDRFSKVLVNLTFDADLSSSLPSESAFTGSTFTVAQGGGVNRVRFDVDEVWLDSNNPRRLRLKTSIFEASIREEIVIGYTKPTSGNTLQGARGHEVPSFSFTGDAVRANGQNAPPSPVTAEFTQLPLLHTGEAFTARLVFSDEFAVTAGQIRAGLTVTGGSLTALARVTAGEDRQWDLTVTPDAAADPVGLTLTPKESCETENAICTEQGGHLEAEAVAEVAGREPTHVVSARLTSHPGANGTWDTGETVTAAVEFSRQVSYQGPPGVTPTLGITLDGTRREAALTSTGWTDTLTFSHAVTAADSGATTVVLVANGLALNGTLLFDSDAYRLEPEVPADTLLTTPLTASFEDMPESHDGSRIRFGLTLSEEPSVGHTALRDEAFEVTGGTVFGAQRKETGSNRRWTISVDPDSATATVTITLPETTDCEAAGAICTADGRPLLGSLSATVEGEERGPELSVADASATEGDTVAFAVSLSIASEQEVTVDYATSDGTAESGTDFTAASGTLTFVPGELSKTVGVATADDSDDEEDETFTLTLSNASGAGLRGATATGTIVDNDSTVLTVSFEDLPESHNGMALNVRLAFSEEVEVGHETIRSALEVTGGSVTGVSRSQGASNRRWRATVEPASKTDTVTVTLPETTDCDASGAICTGDDRPLSHSLSATIAPPTLLTATFEDMPATHDGTRIRFGLSFSEELEVSHLTLRDEAFEVTGGTLFGAQRKERGSDRRWTVSVDPVSADSTVTITLLETTDCDADGAICTYDNRPLSHSLSDTVAVEGEEPTVPSLAVADASAAEGDTITFTVSLSAASTDQVTVEYATASGTAESGTDFTAASGTLTFVAGDSSKTVSVATTDDSDEEEDESFTVTLSNASGAGLADATATGTIVDNDASATPLTATFEDVPESHDGSRISFSLTFSEELDVGYQTLRDEAFQVTGGTVFGARRKETGSNRRWTILVDPTFADSAMTITLPETTDCEAAGAICTDDDRPLSHSLSATVEAEEEEATVPSVSVADASATEGDTVTFTVSLSEASSQQVTVDYATSGGTAESGTDFTAASGTLTFDAGQTSKTVSVTTADDSVEEEDETFTLTLGNASGATLGDAAATGTIVDNDTEAPTPLTATFEDMPETHDGSRIRFGLTFSEEPSVGYQTLRDEAFEVTGGSVFGAQRKETGSNRRWTISVDPDSATATVTITLPETTDCEAAGAICTDDDRPLSHSLSATVEAEEEEATVPSLGVADASATEGDAVTFTVSLSDASSQQVTVDYATTGGTAASGTDFTAASGTLTFDAGDRSKTLSVATTDDSADEEDETFTLTLSNASGASLGDAAATGTIVDNDTEAPTPLTATFEDVPATHDGSAFEFGLTFSEELSISYRTLRDEAFDVTGGDVTRARRKQSASNLRWTITVEPGSTSDTVTISLPETTDCAATGAICTEDKRPLSHSLSATVIDAASAGDAAGGRVVDDAGEALIVADGISPEEAAATLFGEASLGAARLEALDRLGNRNGGYDLGDLISWIDRCRRGDARCGPAPTDSGPASAAGALLAAPAGARGASRPPRSRDAGRGGRSPRAGRPRRARAVGWVLAMLLTVATAWSCTDGSVSLTAPEADPGFLTVSLAAPAANRDSGIFLELEGPGIEAVRAPGFELFESGASERREVILAGSLRTGSVMEFRVPDRNRLRLYRVRVIQVTAEGYELRDPGAYRAVITR